MGQWAERPDGSWAWDATPADPSATRIMSVYSGRTPMTEHPSRDVYNPALGADGGGRYGDPDPIPAIDPDNPVDHVDQLQVGDGPEYWTGSTPEGRQLAFDEYDRLVERHRADRATLVPNDVGLVACPRCGSGVHRDRLNTGD